MQPRGLDYFRSFPENLAFLESTSLAAALLGFVFWGAWWLVERSSIPKLRLLAQFGFVLVLIYPIESVRRYWNTQTEQFDPGSNVALWLIEAILAAGAVGLLFGNRRVLMSARRVTLLLLLMFPALMIDFLMNRLGAEPAQRYAPRPSAPLLASHGTQSPRFVWLIFDELDQRMVFDRRPAYLHFPELDRLREESVSANHAVETATFTAIALPSLISGQIFSGAFSVDASTLDVIPEGSKKPIDWRSEPNVFTRARAAGVNAAMVGWHHPYCRVLGDELVDCFALPSFHSTAALAEEARASREGVWKTVGWLFEWQLVNLRDMLSGAAIPALSCFATPRSNMVSSSSTSKSATMPIATPPTRASTSCWCTSPRRTYCRFIIAANATSMWTAMKTRPWTISIMSLWWTAPWAKFARSSTRPDCRTGPRF